MVCQLPGDFLTLDFHTNDFGDLLASREDAKRRRKAKRGHPIRIGRPVPCASRPVDSYRNEGTAPT